MLRYAAALAAITALLSAPAALGTGLRDRTFTMSLGVNGVEANGPSTRPAISVAGGLVAFESTASNLAFDPNGAVRDIFARDVVAGVTRLVSTAADGGGANGPSTNAAVGGRVVAFNSEASNLVAHDGNGLRDVFARTGTDPIVRVSEAAAGGDPDGASGEADVSDDGRFVVFSSTATNLVPGDGNGLSDVFVRDLSTGSLRRVSQPAGGGNADGPSRAPAISPDGRYVSFYSEARNLVADDANGAGDVFLADLRTGRVERVSVSSREREQNAAVVAPFAQISDVSRDGRFVAFDSDATNLVRRDRNRDTDVFVRDRRRGTTTRVSVDLLGFEANNDSFFPSLSPDGRFVAFQSFATNLAPGDGPREDVFVYDRRRLAPFTASVGSRGERREREKVRQLLQRPVISADGALVGFSSTAGNLAARDARRHEDVFLRVTAAPRVRSIRSPRGTVSSRRPRLHVSLDDRRADDFICVVDGAGFPCRNGARLPALRPGRHELQVIAGGAGMRYAMGGPIVRFTVR